MRMRKYRKPMPLGCREQIFNVLVLGSSKKLLPFKKKKNLAHTSAVVEGTALVCVSFCYFCTL